MKNLVVALIALATVGSANAYESVHTVFNTNGLDMLIVNRNIGSLNWNNLYALDNIPYDPQTELGQFIASTKQAIWTAATLGDELSWSWCNNYRSTLEGNVYSKYVNLPFRDYAGDKSFSPAQILSFLTGLHSQFQPCLNTEYLNTILYQINTLWTVHTRVLITPNMNLSNVQSNLGMTHINSVLAFDRAPYRPSSLFGQFLDRAKGALLTAASLTGYIDWYWGYQYQTDIDAVISSLDQFLNSVPAECCGNGCYPYQPPMNPELKQELRLTLPAIDMLLNLNHKFQPYMKGLGQARWRAANVVNHCQ